MNELLCKDCNRILEPRVEKEWIGEPERGGYQYANICPHCGSEELTEYTYCEVCDVPIPIGNDRCEKCILED